MTKHLKKFTSLLLSAALVITLTPSVDVKAANTIQRFNYNGSYAQDWTAPYDGLYTFTIKGGDGGKVIHGSITNSAGETSSGYYYGAGGITTVQCYIKKGETFYIQVGGVGNNNGTGGFNGGGDSYSGAGGGGATSVTFSNVATLSRLSSDSQLFAVAGGGGGNRNSVSNPSGGNNNHSSINRHYSIQTEKMSNRGGNGGGYRTYGGATTAYETGDSGFGGKGYYPTLGTSFTENDNIYVIGGQDYAGTTFSPTAVTATNGYVTIEYNGEYKPTLTVNYGNASPKVDKFECTALDTYTLAKNSIDIDAISGYTLVGYKIVGDTTGTTYSLSTPIAMSWQDKEITLVWNAALSVKFTDKTINASGRTAAEIEFTQDDEREKTFTIYRSDNGSMWYPAEYYDDGSGANAGAGDFTSFRVTSPGIYGWRTSVEGVYTVILEGARGGQDTSSNGGGRGGRLQANIILPANTTYYFCVGGAGGNDTQGHGGYNGGGGAGQSGSSGGGGGCTNMSTASGTAAQTGEGRYIAIAGGGGGGNLGSTGGAGGTGGNNGAFGVGTTKRGDGGGGGAGYRGGTPGTDNAGKAQGGTSNVKSSYLSGNVQYGASTVYGNGTAYIRLKYAIAKFRGANTFKQSFYIDDVASPVIDSAVINETTNELSIITHDVGSNVYFKVVSTDKNGRNIGEAQTYKNVFAGLDCIYYLIDSSEACAYVPTTNKLNDFSQLNSTQFTAKKMLEDTDSGEYIHIVAVDKNGNRSAIQTLNLKPKFRVFYSNNYLNNTTNTLNIFNDIVTVEGTRNSGAENTTTLVGAVNPTVSKYGESATVKDNVTNSSLGDTRYNLKGYTFVGWSKTSLLSGGVTNPVIDTIKVNSGGSTKVDEAVENDVVPEVKYKDGDVISPSDVLPYDYDNPNLILYMILQPISYSVTYHSNLNSTETSYKQWFFYDYNSERLSLMASKFVHDDSKYKQLGWTETAGSNKVDYNLRGKITENLFSEQNENLDIYAVWKKDIALTFNLNGGTVLDSSNNIVLKGAIYNDVTNYTFDIVGGLTPETDNMNDDQVGEFNSYGKVVSNGLNSAIYKVGLDGTQYRFLGWSLDKDATEPDAGFSVYDSEHNKTYTVSDDTTLYAVWEPVLEVNLSLDRTLGNLTFSNGTDVNGSVTGVTAIITSAKVNTIIEPGEQGVYKVSISGGNNATFKVAFDDRIEDIYSHDGVWKDSLNPKTAEDLDTAQSSGLNRLIKFTDNTITRKFYMPQYIGTKQSYTTSNPDTATKAIEMYQVVFSVSQPSYYYQQVHSGEETIAIDGTIFITNATTSNTPISSILDDLRTKLKIRLK